MNPISRVMNLERSVQDLAQGQDQIQNAVGLPCPSLRRQSRSHISSSRFFQCCLRPPLLSTLPLHSPSITLTPIAQAGSLSPTSSNIPSRPPQSSPMLRLISHKDQG